MLANVLTIVGRVDNVRVIQNTKLLKARHYAIHNLDYTLQRAQPASREVIIEVDILLTLVRKRSRPVHARWTFGIEVGSSWDLDTLEQMLMTVRWSRWGETRSNIFDVAI
jgi:hypothetical protein